MSSRILIIDDEANIRTMIRLALEHVGYEVETAADGDEGIRKATQEHYDLALIDQRMPGLNGMDVQAKIQEKSPETRTIMITAFGTIDLALDSIHAGASDFLRKPFTAETLRTAVKTALEKPAQKLLAVPIGLVCREFTRTTINGFSFDIDPSEQQEPHHHETKGLDKWAKFVVRHADDSPATVKVILPVYVMELVRAYIDSDTVPGGDSFWQALCEEALANYLWQNASLPPDRVLRIEDLTTTLQHWLDGVLTVDVKRNVGT